MLKEEKAARTSSFFFFFFVEYYRKLVPFWVEQINDSIPLHHFAGVCSPARDPVSLAGLFNNAEDAVKALIGLID